MLKQFNFLQKNSRPHQGADCRRSDVAEWVDGGTPEVFKSNFIDAPVDDVEEEVEELGAGHDSNKYRCRTSALSSSESPDRQVGLARAHC